MSDKITTVEYIEWLEAGAEIAYDSYRHWRITPGHPRTLPAWDNLPRVEQLAWRTAIARFDRWQAFEQGDTDD